MNGCVLWEADDEGITCCNLCGTGALVGIARLRTGVRLISRCGCQVWLRGLADCLQTSNSNQPDARINQKSQSLSIGSVFLEVSFLVWTLSLCFKFVFVFIQTHEALSLSVASVFLGVYFWFPFWSWAFLFKLVFIVLETDYVLLLSVGFVCC